MRSVHEISKLMYDLALKSFNKDYFTFQQLIEKMRSAKLIRSDEQVGIIYLQLLNSPNFLYVGDNK
jgi:DNA-directed RNA polymerase delta subunit